jgi:hypothetical protein
MMERSNEVRPMSESEYESGARPEPQSGEVPGVPPVPPANPWADRLAAIRADESRATDTARQEADGAMRKQYPGEYVAYSEDGATAQRTILAHDPSLAVVRKALAHLAEEQLGTIKVAYCDPPARYFRGGYDGRWPAGAPAAAPTE